MESNCRHSSQMQRVMTRIFSYSTVVRFMVLALMAICTQANSQSCPNSANGVTIYRYPGIWATPSAAAEKLCWSRLNQDPYKYTGPLLINSYSDGTPHAGYIVCTNSFGGKGPEYAGDLPVTTCPNPHLGSSCSAPTQVGASVNITTGNEYHVENDFSHSGNLSFRRYYNSHSQAAYKGSLGQRWRHNFEQQLLIDGSTALVLRSNGRVLEFSESGGSWASEMEPSTALELISNPDPQYLLTTPSGNREIYQEGGRWVSTATPNGRTITATYDRQQLLTVSDDFNNTIEFTYHPNSNLLKDITVPGGEKYSYAYTASNSMLESVTTPDVTTRTYHYTNTSFPQALTGITDEEGNRYATWVYDAQERVEEEFLGVHDNDGTFTDEVGYKQFVYGSNQTTVTNALGKDTVYHFDTFAGVKRVTDIDGIASANCSAQDGDTGFDYYTATGLLKEKTDSRGNITEYHYNSRGLEDWRKEAKGTADERTITTTWHADFNVPQSTVETGLTTVHGYNASGQHTSTVYIETSGHNSAWRLFTYGYTTEGKIKTIDGPLAGNVDVETFDYYSANGFLWKRTNSLGHVTEVLTHNGWGLPTQIKGPNNIITTLTYSDRGWLETSSTDVGATTSTTTYDYDDVGQLTSLTLPNNVTFTYEYDTAHRLEAIQNSKGERIEYTLDQAGNRTGEVIKTGGGSTVYTTSRQFDELSRLIKHFDHTYTYHQYSYDSNGNVTSEIDRSGEYLGRIFDGLDRLKQIDFADTGTASYVYNQLDQLTSVTDQEQNTTTYDYDGLGNLISMTSPDTGTTTYEYDVAGNRTKQTNANGFVTEYVYDVLNRLTNVNYPANTVLNATYGYDSTFFNHGIGRLTSITDNTGTTNFFYDELGRVVVKVVVIQSVSYLWSYAYDVASNLLWVKMPDGRYVDYVYDSHGQISTVQTRETETSTPVTLANNFTYLPFGAISGWQFGNGVAHSVTYDLGYRISQIVQQGSATVLDLSYGYDANHNIDTLSNGVNGALSQSFTYDEVNRIDTANGNYGAFNYDYDLAGNRTLFSRPNYSETFNVSLTGNQLDSINIDDNGTQSQRSFTYDSSGNTTTDSLGGQTHVYAHNNRIGLTNGPNGGAYVFVNAQGQRVITAAGDGTHRHYLYDANGDLVMESNGANGQVLKQYIRVDGQLLAVIGG